MKRFIDILKTRDLARFRATLGILGMLKYIQYSKAMSSSLKKCVTFLYIIISLLAL